MNRISIGTGKAFAKSVRHAWRKGIGSTARLTPKIGGRVNERGVNPIGSKSININACTGSAKKKETVIAIDCKFRGPPGLFFESVLIVCSDQNGYRH